MTGWQIAGVLALCLVLPVICGFSSHCAPSIGSVDKLCTFIAGGMIGVVTANARAKRRHRSTDEETKS